MVRFTSTDAWFVISTKLLSTKGCHQFPATWQDFFPSISAVTCCLAFFILILLNHCHSNAHKCPEVTNKAVWIEQEVPLLNYLQKPLTCKLDIYKENNGSYCKQTKQNSRWSSVRFSISWQNVLNALFELTTEFCFHLSLRQHDLSQRASTLEPANMGSNFATYWLWDLRL